jgi:DNA helicase HerA-like ATPase
MISNSINAAKLLTVFMASEPAPEDDDITDGIYVGKTLVYNLPFFLNNSKLINPHISIVGMTGSGKSYLLKSMIMRMLISSKVNVLIIDWSSEYSQLVMGLGGNVRRDIDRNVRLVDFLCNRISSIDLSTIKDPSIAGCVARDILIEVSKSMSCSELNERVSWVIVIDEAWKLADYEKVLGRLFREGRKFGFSIIVATQLMKDVNNEILANAACSFVFRLQGSDNFDALSSSGLLKYNDVETVKSLKRGCCVVSMRNRSNFEQNFVVKVEGFSFKSYSLSFCGEKMKMSKESISNAISNMGIDTEGRLKLFRFFEDAGQSLDLVQVISMMMGLGVKRIDIISFFSELGVDEASVALSIESIKGVRAFD